MYAPDSFDNIRSWLRSGTPWVPGYGVAVLVSAILGYGLGRAATGAEIRSAELPRAAALDSSTRSFTSGPVYAATLRLEPGARPYVSSSRRELGELPRRLLDAYLARPDAWRERLVPILAEHRVPPEFLYLALVESGMDPEAESPASAAGLWQFAAPTARHFGLVVEEEIDERLDWRRSTRAAGRYLRQLHDRFGTWELAAAAYNAGPGKVSRALAETGADSYWDLLEAGRLPVETRNYVPKFLAIVQLASERDAEREAELATLAAAGD